MKVLIAGGYGIGNLGDEAQLSVIASKLRRQHASLKVLSAAPKDTAAMHGLDAVSYFRPYSVFKALIAADVLVIGGGGVFDTRIAGRTRRAMAWFYLALAYAALIMKRRIWLEGIDVLTPDHTTYALLVHILRHSDRITLRDDQTFQNLARLTPLRAEVVGDLALELKAAPLGEKDILTISHDISSFNICLAMRPTGNPGFDEKMASLAKAIVKWSGERDAQVFFIALSHNRMSKEEDDVGYARRLIASLGKVNRVSLFTNRVHPAKLQAFIGRMDFLVGMRLQSLVMAHNMGVPMVAIAYHPKVRLFAESIGVEVMEPNSIEQSAIIASIENTGAQRLRG